MEVRMRSIVSYALAGVLIALAAGSAAAQQAGTTSREMNREYSGMLKKGKGAEVMREERVVERPTYRQTVVALEDQFPEQGSDNPSGLLSNGDWRDDNRGPETAIGRGNPITLENQVGQLDPQEPAPLYRRGPIVRTD
jgi:hypothetical protein